MRRAKLRGILAALDPELTEEFLAGPHRAERAIAGRLMRESGLRAQQTLRFMRTTDNHQAWPVAES